jgi:hypothetical protein
MKMKQDKTERLIIRITEDLKNKIEALAKKQNITTSELVRTVLEETVCKKDKEIEECIMMVTTIAKHINSIMEELVFTSLPHEVNKLSSELRHYKKLSYEHQLNAIEMILEYEQFNDAKAQSLIEISDQAQKALNNYIKKTSEYNGDGMTSIFETIQDKINLLENNVWNSTYKLYMHLCNNYFNK